MFGFGNSSRSAPKGDLFSVEELRDIVAQFPPGSSSASNDGDLIPLRSGDGYIARAALVKSYEDVVRGKDGKIQLATIESQLDVDRLILLPLLESQNSFMLSSEKDAIITRCEQERLVEELYAEATSNFVPAKQFAVDNSLDTQSILKLVALSDVTHEEAPLQLLHAPSQPPSRSLELGNSFVHTLSVLLSLKNGVVEKVDAAMADAKTSSWLREDMRGLDSPTLARLAQQFVREFEDPTASQGEFEIAKNEVRFVPRSYLLRKARRTLKEVGIGAEPYADLDLLSKRFPQLFANVEAAKDFTQRECLHKDGSPYKWHFSSKFVIGGDVGLNNTAQKCLELWGPQRWIDLRPFVKVFPSEIRKDLLTLLQDRTVELWRYCGGEVPNALGIEHFLIFKTFISELDTASKRIARICADDTWARPTTADKLSLAQQAEAELFLDQFQSESELPKDLLESLWTDTRVPIKATASASFDERLAELASDNRSQLQTLWKSRLYLPLRIHKDALAVIQNDTLKEQLAELLRIYASQDLVPSFVKRVQSRNLAKGSATQKQIERLLQSTKKDDPDGGMFKEIEKAHDKLGNASLNEHEVVSERMTRLTNMVKAMELDTDAPRLFLTTVIILLATKTGKGIVYATGKFAPRLLKMLKEDLDENLFSKLESLKEAVKAGSATQAQLQQLREIAREAVLERNET